MPDGHRMAIGMRHPDMIIDHQWDEQILFKTYQEMFKNDHAHVPTDLRIIPSFVCNRFFLRVACLRKCRRRRRTTSGLTRTNGNVLKRYGMNYIGRTVLLLKKERDREAKNQGLKRKHQTAERGKYLKELRRDVSLRDASTSDKARWILKRWEKDHERDPKTVPEPYAFETIRTKI